MGDKLVICKECGCQMAYVENKRKNEFYLIKVDTWVCTNCGRAVEETRKDPRYDYK